MAFQKQVDLYNASAVAGDVATLNPAVHTVGNPFAEGPVTVGNFVWEGTDPETQAKATGTGAPIGIVRRVLAYVNADLRSEGTLTLAAGSTLTVEKIGDLWVTSSTAATKGQKVFATLADGSIQTGAAGATVAGAVETEWVVEKGGEAGDLIVVSRWN